MSEDLEAIFALISVERHLALFCNKGKGRSSLVSRDLIFSLG